MLFKLGLKKYIFGVKFNLLLVLMGFFAYLQINYSIFSIHRLKKKTLGSHIWISDYFPTINGTFH